MEASHASEELQPTNVEAMLAVMTVEVRNMGKLLEKIEQKQEQQVPRNEFEQWKMYVERELATRRLPWTSVGAFFTGAVAVALVVIDRFAQ